MGYENGLPVSDYISSWESSRIVVDFRFSSWRQVLEDDTVQEIIVNLECVCGQADNSHSACQLGRQTKHWSRRGCLHNLTTLADNWKSDWQQRRRHQSRQQMATFLRSSDWLPSTALFTCLAVFNLWILFMFIPCLGCMWRVFVLMVRFDEDALEPVWVTSNGNVTGLRHPVRLACKLCVLSLIGLNGAVGFWKEPGIKCANSLIFLLLTLRRLNLGGLEHECGREWLS